MILDKDNAMPYVGAYVRLIKGAHKGLYAVLLRVYDDGLLTSAGFYKEVEFFTATADIETVDADVIYCSFAALHLPFDWANRTFLFKNVKDTDYCYSGSLLKVDYNLCVNLDSMNRPQIDDALGAFITVNGLSFNMIRMRFYNKK